MSKTRMEAFSDGVIAIIITIMVLEMKVPHGDNLAALQPVLPVFFSYILSFLYIGIYWNNHHHMMHAVQHVNGPILWANMHLLFWLSLYPFVTAYAGENHFSEIPMILYGTVLLLAAIAYYILSRTLIRYHGKDSALAKAVGSDTKGRISVVFYALGILLTFVSRWISVSLYVLVALMWFVPDRRIEKTLGVE